MTVRRVELKHGGHAYYDGNRRLPTVTQLISQGFPSGEGLMRWYAQTAGLAATADPNPYAGLSPQAAKRLAVQLVEEQRDTAADRGRAIHELADAYAGGEPVEVPDELVGPVEQYAKFMAEWDVRPVLREALVVNRAVGYAGTLDLLAWLEGDAALAVIDIKTGSSAGWPREALQLTAYRWAEAYLVADGEEAPMPRADLCAVLWLQSDFYQLIPMASGPAEFEAFQAVARVATFNQRERAATVGQPLAPSGAA